jgi:hypothetical protein
MSENPLKNELLKQNGKSPVDQEVSRLHAIIAAEERRVRRLTFWTIGVWAVWILMVSLSVGIPMVLYRTAQHTPTSQPAAAAPAPVAHHTPGTATAIFATVVGIVLIVAFVGLPLAGVVLVIMLIVTRRTASLNQVRASLGAVDAQLRMLGAPGVKSDPPPTP